MASQQAILDVVSSLQVSEYNTFAAFVLVFYDWLINLDEEIHYFWDFRKGRKLTAAAVIYGMTRYPLIVMSILELQTSFPMSETACQINYHVQTVASFLWTLSPGVFSAVRVYALEPDRRIVAVATFFLHVIPSLTILVLNAADKLKELPSPFNCTVSEAPTSAAIAFRLTFAGRICTIVGDLLVLFVTWHKTYAPYKSQKGVLKGPSITRVMLYNGSIYFIILTGMNILTMILARTQDQSGPSLENVASIITNPMTAVLISHFLFDLRRSDRTANIASSPSAVPSLNIAGDIPEDHGALPAFIASMGSLVDRGLQLVGSPDADDDMTPRHAPNEGLSDEEC